MWTRPHGATTMAGHRQTALSMADQVRRLAHAPGAFTEINEDGVVQVSHHSRPIESVVEGLRADLYARPVEPEVLTSALERRRRLYGELVGSAVRGPLALLHLQSQWADEAGIVLPGHGGSMRQASQWTAKKACHAVVESGIEDLQVMAIHVTATRTGSGHRASMFQAVERHKGLRRTTTISHMDGEPYSVESRVSAEYWLMIESRIGKLSKLFGSQAVAAETLKRTVAASDRSQHTPLMAGIEPYAEHIRASALPADELWVDRSPDQVTLQAIVGRLAAITITDTSGAAL